MDFITIIYLIYNFISLYMLLIFILIYIPNRGKIYEFFEPEKELTLSIVVPCFNESDTIGENIESLLNSDYKGLRKIVVVDDCSSDNSYEVIKKYAETYSGKGVYAQKPIVIAAQTPMNTGKAAGAKNWGSKLVDTDLIGFSDADSFPKKDAISKMIGFFNDKKVGAVTSRVLVQNREKFLARLQAIEYKIIAFTRKLFGFIDAIYVTNGPLSIYRKEAFDQVGGFDEKNLTEDIEITWNFVHKGWKVSMAIPALVYTVVPERFNEWFKQRIRWNVGGMQTLNKYKSEFFRMGMLGAFIMPFFVLSWILGLVGLGFLIYRIGRRLIVEYLATKYSIVAQTTVLRLNDINLSPSILIFFGVAIFLMSLSFTGVALIHSRERDFKKHGLFGVLTYMLVYLLAYPLLLVTSIYKFVKGDRVWGRTDVKSTNNKN